MSTQERTTFFRPLALAARWGTSGSTVRRLMYEGKLPRPIQISPRVYGWSLATIEKFEAERDAAAAGKRPLKGVK